MYTKKPENLYEENSAVIQCLVLDVRDFSYSVVSFSFPLTALLVR